ncbi:MAG: N-acyl-D-amino-acid deacylase [Verrucomicrobiales bacterium]
MPNPDLIIRNGTVVDGTGGPTRIADVVIRDGMVSEITESASTVATREIDAEGAWVTPGFIDPHTHLDAQLFWDPTGRPSVQHGVTTVVTGNCGFGIAPCGNGAEEYLLRCLEAVEEIPFASTTIGVPFGWSDFTSYLDALDNLDLGVNVAAMVPHSPLRHSVMGDRAWSQEATNDDVTQMSALLRQALASGAVGFASSRGPNHVDGDGRPVPSRLANDAELRALVAETTGKVWQINIKSKGDPTAAQSLAEVAEYAAWSDEFGVDLSWTPLLVLPGDTVAWRRLVDQAADLSSTGARVVPQVSPLPLVASIDLSGRSLAESVTGWETAMRQLNGLGQVDRIAVLADESFRQLLRDAREDPHAMLAPNYDRWRLVASTTRPELVGQSMRQVGVALGLPPTDALCDLAIADELATVVQVPLVNLDAAEVVAAVSADSTLIGLGDAGAHVASITNYTYPTFLLAEAAAGNGMLPIEQVVREMTSRPAELFGLTGRGVLTEGAAADVVVVDPHTVALGPSRRVNDLPGGHARLLQEAVGYRSVIVGGVEVVVDDQPVEVAAGRVLR